MKPETAESGTVGCSGLVGPEVWNPLDHGIRGAPLMVPAHEYNRLRKALERVADVDAPDLLGLVRIARDALKPNTSVQGAAKPSPLERDVGLENKNG